MTTLHDIQTRDLTTDEIRAMVDSYETIRAGKIEDLSILDNSTFHNKFGYFIHSFSRLNIPGFNPETTEVRLALRVLENKQTAVELTFADGKSKMTVLWSGKHVTVTSNVGLAADGSWRDEVRPIFKTLKATKAEAKKAQKAEKAKAEKTVKKAAVPAKKAKKPAATAKTVEAKVKKTKAAKAETPVETDVLAEVNAVLTEDAQPQITDEIDQMVADGEPLPL